MAERRSVRPRAVVVGLVLTATACLPADHPLRYGSVLKVEHRGAGTIWPMDLDGDGRDEHLHQGSARLPFAPRGPTSWLVFTDGEGRAFEQTNYDGDLLPPRLLDVAGDGAPEVVVPVLRGDSLFLSVASGEGRKLFGFFLASGEPRVEPDGVLPWDPTISGMWAVDVDGDGARELVTAITTAYARRPRGLMMHALPGGEPIGRVWVGSPPSSMLAGDFDGDDRPEVLAATMDTKQDVDDGGFSDRACYLILYDLTPSPVVAWSRVLTPGGASTLGWTDVDGDGTREVLLARGQGTLTAEVLDARSLRVLRRRVIEGRFFTPVLVDLDGDLRPEVVASGVGDAELVLLDHDLRSVRRVRLPFNVGYGYAWPDLDGDGIQELEFALGGGGFVLVGTDLRIKAVFRRGMVSGVERRGPNLPARIVIADGDQALVATLRANPWALPLRYGPGALGTLLALASALLVRHVRQLRYRLRVLRAAGTEALEAGGRGLMVLDDRGRIRWRGSGSRDALGEAWDTASNLDELATGAPSLAAWCRDATRAVPARARRAEIPLGRRAGARRETVSLTPVFIGAASDPHWIVRLEAPADASERAWRMMAQRIAHAVKNPLTHMLLTVQRLQTEYRERAPAVASRLDPYADRIQDGVGQLRRLTSSFLKLVDLAEPELRPTDLGEVLAEFATQTRGRLPHDIQLRLEVEGEVPSAPIDREQVHVALDNLVTNAVNALEAGGTITLALSPAPGPGPAPGGEAGDYVQVEVMDTGKGIAPDDRVHIFEPGYSTAEDGSGLGLAIVRKIVADHGGHVSVDSEVGVGSVFTLLFPVAEGARTEEPV